MIIKILQCAASNLRSSFKRRKGAPMLDEINRRPTATTAAERRPHSGRYLASRRRQRQKLRAAPARASRRFPSAGRGGGEATGAQFRGAAADGRVLSSIRAHGSRTAPFNRPFHACDAVLPPLQFLLTCCQRISAAASTARRPPVPSLPPPSLP